MTWWRKTSPTDTGSHNINGWVQIKSIWRKASPQDTINSAASANPWVIDGWLKIKSAWRHVGSGIWEKIFGSANPYPSSIDSPQLWFIQSPYTSVANKSIDADQITGAAFQNSKMYVQRGKWLENPVYFEVRMQKKPSGGSWTLVDPPGVNTTRFSYVNGAEYLDSEYTKIWPASSGDWPLVSLSDIKNKTLFRAKFKVSQSTDPTETELNQLEFHFPSDAGIAPRLAFNLNPYAEGDIVEDTDASIPSLKVLGLKWRFDTSFFPVTDASQVIGKQILEVTDFFGNTVLGPYNVSVNNFNPQNISINYTQEMIDSGEEYIINLYVVANDYYYQSGYSLAQHIADTNETIKIYSMVWTPEMTVEDPSVNITSRTQSSFDANWYSPDAESYNVNIYQSINGNSISGYPVVTENISASPFGLSNNILYTVEVTALAGPSNQFESNPVSASVRTLAQGIPANLGNPYDITSSSFKIQILNYSEISDFDIIINSNSGSVSRVGNTITISSIPQGQEVCVTATTSRINDLDLTAVSYDIATSNQVCFTIQTWYCVTYINTGECSTSTSYSNVSGSGSGYSTFCSTSTLCCARTVYGEWSSYTSCVNGSRTRSRSKTVYNQDCSVVTTTDTETSTCWYCTQSVSSNCAGCTYSIQSSNISQSGSGYSISCSTSNYPNCGTPCICDSTKESQCSAWTYSSCVNGQRTKTRTCPAGSPCATSVTETCYYCTTSVNSNCAGCGYSIESSNISQSGSGYSISCSTSNYPSCNTPCTCDSTQAGLCGNWTTWSSCSNGTRSRTRTCPAGSPCLTTETQTCYYCTTSVDSNCAGCTQFIEGYNASQSGSGYSTSCSTSGYPNCGTPCTCNSTQSDLCTSWSAWSNCSGGTRSRTRTCPAGSPCATSETQTCWYCTTSVNVNCEGCTYSIGGSDDSQTGSGYSISCSTSGFPTCGTPCVTTTTYYCTTSVNSNCAGCTNFESTTNQSGSGSGYSTSCSTSSYPACQTPCVSTKYNCNSFDVNNSSSPNYYVCYSIGQCAATVNNNGSRTSC